MTVTDLHGAPERVVDAAFCELDLGKKPPKNVCGLSPRPFLPEPQ